MPPSPPPPRPPRKRRVDVSDGRAYIALALLGWGLSILLGITPHEDRLVGAGLTAFGAVLLVTAPVLPHIAHLRSGVVAGAALAVSALVLAFVLVADAALDARKLSIVLLGCAVAAASPWFDRRVPLPRRGSAGTNIGTLAVFATVVLGAPLAVWALQATFKTAIGATPVEAFVRVGLLAPLHLVLAALGMDASVHGQAVTYTTRQGPLLVNVGAACSGVQAMALFGGVLALYLLVERPGGKRLALWCAIGIAGVYVANLLRLITVFLVGYQWGGDALSRVHAQAGWIFFVAWALLFARLAPRSRATAGLAR